MVVMVVATVAGVVNNMRIPRHRLIDIFITEAKQNIVVSDVPASMKEKDYLKKFIPFAMEQLEIESLPDIEYTKDRLNKPMTTGVFIPSENKIMVYIRNRAFVDWLRTLAHELVHYKQHVEQRIPEKIVGRNKQLEDEANSTAADLIHGFVQLDEKHKEIYDL
jgi:Zn-dependent peptidase ImmA (M78 family)